MTQFTSFVAVEEMIVTDGGKPRRIDVPVEVPEGVKGDVDPAESITNLSAFSVNAGRTTLNARVARSARGVGVGRGAGQLRTLPSPPNAAPVVSSVSTSMPEMIATDRTQLVDQQAAELQLKLHRSVLAVVQKLQKKETLSSTDEGGFIHDGKAEVQVWLTDKSSETLAQLKELGFEVVLDAKSSKVIIGRLPVEKLEALAKLKAVKYVAPQK
jgi:hypothetical protein